MRVLGTLKEKIKSDRHSGLITRESSHRDATVAIDICLGTKGMVDRKVIHELTRLSNRWAILSRVLPLLILTFTSIVERIVYVQSLSIFLLLKDLRRRTCRLIYRFRPPGLVAKTPEISRCFKSLCPIRPVQSHPQRYLNITHAAAWDLRAATLSSTSVSDLELPRVHILLLWPSRLPPVPVTPRWGVCEV